MFKNLVRKYFDYDIVGEYFDTDGNGHYFKKYVKKWHFKKRRCLLQIGLQFRKAVIPLSPNYGLNSNLRL